MTYNLYESMNDFQLGFMLNILFLAVLFILIIFDSWPDNHVDWMHNKRELPFYAATYARFLAMYLSCVSAHLVAIDSNLYDFNYSLTFTFVIFLVNFIQMMSKQLSLSKYVLTATRAEIGSAQRILLLCLIWFSVFMLSACINYLLYIAYPSQFSVSGRFNYNPRHEPMSFTAVKISCEFLYYTFMLMVTYSNVDTIVAVGGFAKLLQVFEILVFYVFVGVFISSAIGQVYEPKIKRKSFALHRRLVKKRKITIRNRSSHSRINNPL